MNHKNKQKILKQYAIIIQIIIKVLIITLKD